MYMWKMENVYVEEWHDLMKDALFYNPQNVISQKQILINY